MLYNRDGQGGHASPVRMQGSLLGDLRKAVPLQGLQVRPRLV